MPLPLASLQTPCLLLDKSRMERNIARVRDRLATTGASFRPHLKTSKSLEVALRLMPTPQGPAMVSTLREAEIFAGHGVSDLTYGVGISPDKLPRVQAIRRTGSDLAVLVDSVEQAAAVAAACEGTDPIPVLIEIDCDGHRSGVRPDDADLLLAIARALAPSGLRGVLTHAGESYAARGRAALETAAEQERRAVVTAAGILRGAGLPCPIVSLGSTPALHVARSVKGITEFRAGVFVFFDLFQSGVGVCTTDYIALSVLTTVIGHQPARGWTICDAGWMAMSRDRGTAAQAVDQGYGLVCDREGRPIDDLVMISANQEHGTIAARPGSVRTAPHLPVGTRLRVLPNHACATAAQHDLYHVIDAAGEVAAEWPRFSGW